MPAAERAEGRSRGFAELVGSAMRLYAGSFTTLVKVVAVIVVPLGIVHAFIAALVLPDTSMGLFQPGGEPEIDGGAIAAFFVAALVAALFSFVGTQIATAASLKTVVNAYAGERTEWRESILFAFRRLPSLLWLAFLVGLVVVVGLLLLIVPGVILLVSTSVAVPVLLVEGSRGWSAVGRSRELVRGAWWRVCGVLLLSYLAVMVVSTIVSTAFGVGRYRQSGFNFSAVPDVIATSIVNVVTIPFITTVVAVIYLDLRAQKEDGFDAAALAERDG